MDGEASTGTQDAEELADDDGLVLGGDEVEDAIGEDTVDRVVANGQRSFAKNGVGKGDLGRSEAGTLSVGASADKHVIAHVEADDLTRCANLASGEEAVYAAAAAEVENVLALVRDQQASSP